MAHQIVEARGTHLIINAAGQTVEQHAEAARAHAALRRLDGPAAAALPPLADDVADAEDDEPTAPAFPVLAGTVGDLKAALERGELDGSLDALAAAEAAGKNRSSALAAIAARQAAGNDE